MFFFVVFSLLLKSSATHHFFFFIIGGLFSPLPNDNDRHTSDPQEIAFRYAVDKINADNKILPRSKLQAEIERIMPQDSFHASKRVCHLMKTGVAAIFGPQSPHTASHVQSICDTMEVSLAMLERIKITNWTRSDVQWIFLSTLIMDHLSSIYLFFAFNVFEFLSFGLLADGWFSIVHAHEIVNEAKKTFEGRHEQAFLCLFGAFLNFWEIFS